jgi:hypothetical protein
MWILLTAKTPRAPRSEGNFPYFPGLSNRQSAFGRQERQGVNLSAVSHQPSAGVPSLTAERLECGEKSSHR